MTPERSKEVSHQTGRVASKAGNLCGQTSAERGKAAFEYAAIFVAISTLNVFAQSAGNQLAMALPLANSLELTLQVHDRGPYGVSEGSTPFARVVPQASQDIPNSDLVPKNGLIHYWSLDQTPGSTLALDAIGRANITLAGTAVFTTSSKVGSGALSLPRDQAAKCSGVTTPADMLAQNQLTLSLWYQRACEGCAVETGQELGDDGAEIALQAWVDGNLYASIGGNGADTQSYAGIPQNDTNWHLATLVFDGTQTKDADRLKLYVDGVQQTLRSFNRPVPTSTTTVARTFYIGALDCGQVNDAGSIDDVRVYNRALSASEVSNLYKATNSAGAEHADRDSKEHEKVEPEKK